LDKILMFKGLTQFEVENGVLFFAEKDSIRAENWRGGSSKKTAPPFGTAQSEGTVFWLSKKRVFVRSEAGVEVYGF
jgi:hypothetical protein